MTYGEKYKEVFGYYPEQIPCPEECPVEFRENMCDSCKYRSIDTNTTFKKEEEKNEEKKAARPCDRSNLSPFDIYNYLRTANPSEYGVIYAIVAFKLYETMDFEDFLTQVFADLFAVSDKIDPEVMYKAQQMILKHYGEEG
ncbi:MAG: hypothetical protein VZR54_08970 [Ruminococcus sp.]|nr:hypothetical protein [Ruminococcus sp.]